MNRAAALLLIAAAVLAGCKTHGRREPVWPWPTDPVVEPGQPRTQPVPDPMPGVVSPIPPARPAPPAAGYPKSAAEASGPAVMSLLQQAKAERSAGRHDSAGAVLERALRIEPRNPFIWQELARTHLDGDDAEQAESVAQRSNSFARGNPWVESGNWRIIATAREKRGDNAGALQARARADEIERALPPS